MTTGVTGKLGTGTGLSWGCCCAPPDWGRGSGTVDPVPASNAGRDGRAGEGADSTPRSPSHTKGRSVRREESAVAAELRATQGGGRARAERRDRQSWAGGRPGGGPRCPRCGEVASQAGRHRPAGETYLWPLPPVAPRCPLSLAGAGSPARRPPAPRSRQLLRECSKRSGSPWGGEGAERRGRGGGGGRVSRAGRPRLSCTQPGSPGRRAASK